MEIDHPTPDTKTGGAGGEQKGQDLYLELKQLQRLSASLAVQEAYVREETKNLKSELARASEEVKRIQSVPLVIVSRTLT